MKVTGKSKGWLTLVMVGTLMGAAVTAQANGFQATPDNTGTSVALIPLVSAISFALARKRA